MSSDHLQDSAERDQLWASLRGLRPELERLAAGELDGSDRQNAMTVLLARIMLLELQFRADDVGAE
jgi:hypothetical protein